MKGRLSIWSWLIIGCYSDDQEKTGSDGNMKSQTTLKIDGKSPIKSSPKLFWSCLTSQNRFENRSDHSEIWQTTYSFDPLFPVNGNKVVWFSYARRNKDRIRRLIICNPLSPILRISPMNTSDSSDFIQNGAAKVVLSMKERSFRSESDRSVSEFIRISFPIEDKIRLHEKWSAYSAACFLPSAYCWQILNQMERIWFSDFVPYRLWAGFIESDLYRISEIPEPGIRISIRFKDSEIDPNNILVIQRNQFCESETIRL